MTTPPNEHTSEGGRDGLAAPSHGHARPRASARASGGRLRGRSNLPVEASLGPAAREIFNNTKPLSQIIWGLSVEPVNPKLKGYRGSQPSTSGLRAASLTPQTPHGGPRPSTPFGAQQARTPSTCSPLGSPAARPWQPGAPPSRTRRGGSVRLRSPLLTPPLGAPRPPSCASAGLDAPPDSRARTTSSRSGGACRRPSPRPRSGWIAAWVPTFFQNRAIPTTQDVVERVVVTHIARPPPAPFARRSRCGAADLRHLVSSQRKGCDHHFASPVEQIRLYASAFGGTCIIAS